MSPVSISARLVAACLHFADGHPQPDADAPVPEGEAPTTPVGDSGTDDEPEQDGAATTVGGRRAAAMAAQNRRFVLVTTWRDGPRMVGSDRTIGAAEISTLPKRSAEDVLRLVPGMLIVQHGSQGKGFQLYLRGFDAAHGSDVQVRLEGIPLNERSHVHGHGYLDLAFIIPETITRVDVKKGAYRLEQGDFATAGSVDFELGVDEASRGLRTSYEAGTTNRHRLVTVYAPRGQPQDTFVAVEAMSDRGYGQNREAQRLGTLAQARLWSGAADTEVTGLVAGYAARFGLPGAIRRRDFESGRVGFYDAYLDDTGGSSFRGLASLRAHGHPGDHTVQGQVYAGYRRLSLDENFTGFLLDEQRGDRRLQTHDATTAGLSLGWSHRPVDIVQVEAMATYQADVLAQSERRLDAETRSALLTTRALAGHQHHLAAGPGVTLIPKRWARLGLSLRADLFAYDVRDQTDLDQPVGPGPGLGTLDEGPRSTAVAWSLSPRATLALDAGAHWSFFAAYGRGVRSPEARAATAGGSATQVGVFEQFDGGRPQVTNSEDAEAGVRWAPHDAVDVGATGFGVWIPRESVFDHVSGFNVERNATRRLGVEGWVMTRPVDWLLLGLDASYADARFVQSGNAVPGAPRFLANLSGSLLHPVGARAGVRWSILGPRPLAFGAVAGAYTVMDLSAGYRWRFIQFDVAVDNVFGLRWREGEYHYASYWDRDTSPSALPAIHYVAGYPLSARFILTGYF